MSPGYVHSFKFGRPDHGCQCEDCKGERLWDAALDLLVACQAAEHWLSCSESGDGVEPVEILRVLRAALAKAGQ